MKRALGAAFRRLKHSEVYTVTRHEAKREAGRAIRLIAFAARRLPIFFATWTIVASVGRFTA